MNDREKRIGDREGIRRSLERHLAHPDPRLIDYQRHVLRYIDCAPEGAIFLPAPLMGWDGTPLASKSPQGPWGRYAPRLREARIARGLHPLGGRYGEDGKPLPPEAAYAATAAVLCMRQGGSN